MAKATTTIKQVLNSRPEQAAWFAANQVLYNRVCAFSFAVIQAHVKILDLSNKEALTALEKLTHPTQSHPAPIMPLAENLIGSIYLILLSPVTRLSWCV